MSSFTTPLEFEFLGKGLFRLTMPFEYHVGDYPSQSIITVPVGFMTDLASTPRLLWDIFPPDGDYAKAAVVHDYLYRTRLVGRKQADQIFYEAMGVLGVGPVSRRLIYVAVRIFGAPFYGI